MALLELLGVLRMKPNQGWTAKENRRQAAPSRAPFRNPVNGCGTLEETPRSP
jgi:hypothetical protein